MATDRCCVDFTDDIVMLILSHEKNTEMHQKDPAGAKKV